MAPKIFGFLLIEGTFSSVFKDKKSLRSHKTVCEPDAGMLSYATLSELLFIQTEIPLFV
jgi:hypothetical protein